MKLLEFFKPEELQFNKKLFSHKSNSFKTDMDPAINDLGEIDIL